MAEKLAHTAKSIAIAARRTRFGSVIGKGDQATMMPPQLDPHACRRRFLQFLAASPLFAGVPAMAQVAGSLPPDPVPWAPRSLETLIGSPAEALSVFDFEPVNAQDGAAGAFRLHGDRPRQRGTLRAAPSITDIVPAMVVRV